MARHQALDQELVLLAADLGWDPLNLALGLGCSLWLGLDQRLGLD